MHLKAHCPGAGLAFAGAGRVLAQVAQILPAYALSRQMPVKSAATAIVNKHLQVHLSLAAQLVYVRHKLPLIRADGSAQAVVVVEYGSKPEGQNCGMLEAVGDDPGVVHAGSLVQGFRGVVFADNNGQVAGGIKKDLIAAHSEDGFHRNRFAMTGQFGKG